MGSQGSDRYELGLLRASHDKKCIGIYKKNNKALNFDELIKKMDAAIKELKEYSEVKE